MANRGTKPKDPSIETLRGIAIILMVAGHVVGAEANDAMQVADDSPWRLIFWGLQDVRMPLFTVLSGFVYAARPTRDWPQYGSLVKAKMRRVLIPLLVVGTLVFWAKMLNPFSSASVELGDWWKVYFFGMDHVWFLQAIFLIFLAAGMLDAIGFLGKFPGWLTVTALSALLHVSALVPAIDFLGIGPAVRLLPFFLLGYGLKRFPPELSRLWLGFLVLALIAAFFPRILALNEVIAIGDIRVDRSLAMVIGIASVLVLFHFRKALTCRFLTWVGGYAFGIYLFHYFALPIIWIGSRAIGMHSELVKFALGMAAGISFPILLQILSRRSRWARFALFGEKLAPPKELVASGKGQKNRSRRPVRPVPPVSAQVDS
ncbi:acyltransferase [Arthrobacter sp. MI7-26]|uniref:acyltransferase family protein n=1 Tax=Arthrobacter sp. MI7-26 TaxID=2993653 RepID=UPI0022496FA1|nr:acyltransferase [Arthrobacter sp. MI7-26]MCX2747042.1 acyltransferase [Arthrobacter sp. MI7-26]